MFVEPVMPQSFRASYPTFVERVHAVEGQQVKRGQLLFVLDDTQVQADLAQARAVGGRQYDPAMHQVRQSQILDKGGAAGELGRDIDTRHGLADQATMARRDQGGLRLGADMKQLVADQLAIAEPPAVIDDDRAVFGAQLPGRQLQQRRRGADQQDPRLGRCVADRGAAILHRMAAGGISLVRGERGVGGRLTLAHEQVLPGANFEIDTLGFLGERRPRQKHRDH